MKFAIKFSMLAISTCLLAACMGGSIAQQIASSVFTRVADKAVAGALDVDENAPPKKQQSVKLEDTEPDEYWLAMATAGFRVVDGSSPPEASEATPIEEPTPIVQANSLVRVQLYNLLIGDEKAAVYEKARAIGALNLPRREEWPSWNVATGKIENDDKPITFLIPPEIGKLPSGALAVVELASPGDLNIARYRAN